MAEDQTILVVEDEAAIRELVQFHLGQAGFKVLECEEGFGAVDLAMEHQPDLVLLDVMLPGIDGLEVCKILRKRGFDKPVVMLTAMDTETDKIVGLEVGADDYVTKPFSPKELVARVRAHLRRLERMTGNLAGEAGGDASSEPVIEVGPLRVELDTYEAWMGDRQLDLTPKEFELLAFMARYPGRVWRREDLLEHVWGYEYAGESRSVDVHVSHLRDKLEPERKQSSWIVTVRSVGYKFVKGQTAAAVEDR